MLVMLLYYQAIVFSLNCLQTITGSFFSAKHGCLKWILPVCIVLPIIRMWFSGLALAWLQKAASTLKVTQRYVKASSNIPKVLCVVLWMFIKPT